MESGVDDRLKYCCYFDAVLSDGRNLDLFDIIGYNINSLQPEPEIQYVYKPTIEYVEQPQTVYVPVESQGNNIEQAFPNRFLITAGNGPYFIQQPEQRFKRIGGQQTVEQEPFVGLEKQKHIYRLPQKKVVPTTPRPVGAKVTRAEEKKPEEIDITVGDPQKVVKPKKVVKKNTKKKPQMQGGNFYNIRTDMSKSDSMPTQAGQTAAPSTAVATNPQVANTPVQQSPLVIVTDTQKTEPSKANDNTKVILDKPVNDNVKVTIDDKGIVDKLSNNRR